MAISFNESTIESEAFGSGARRQRLSSRERVPETNVVLDRVTLSSGGKVALAVGNGDIGWLQMIAGEATLWLEGSEERLSDTHVALLPPGRTAGLRSHSGAVLIQLTVPRAGRFDAAFAQSPPRFRALDWSREPVLDSRHDARKRIYLVTPKLFGTKALKGEMIIYPQGTVAANHHHEGAEHFMYILRGRGTAWANERPFPVQAGDVVFYRDRERHYLKADEDAELAFSEFFVPGEYQTVWVNPNEVCTWLPTGRDIRGRKPAREIEAHSSAAFASPGDV